MSSSDPLDALLPISGVLPCEVAYLAAKGVSSIRQLAKCSVSEEDFLTRFLVPLREGITIEAVEHKVTRAFDAMCTAMLVMREEATLIRRAEIEGTRASAPSVAAAAALPTAGSSKPQSLDKAMWTKQITRWQNQWTPARVFPSKQILGAEAILARLLHEANVSKLFTPLLLTEVAAARTYNSDNSLNERKKVTAGQSALQQLATLAVQQHGSEPVHQQNDDLSFAASSWACSDCLDAVKWTLRFTEYASDELAEEWTEYWRRLLRSNKIAGDMRVLTEAYSAAAWKIALEMRDGKSWATAATSIVSDADYIKELIGETRSRIDEKSRGEASRGRSPTKRARPAEQRGGQPRVTDIHRRSVSPGGTQLCRNFNLGSCRLNRTGNKRCKFAHLCWTCREDRCGGASNCKQSRPPSQPARDRDDAAKGHKGSKSSGKGGKRPDDRRDTRGSGREGGAGR
jgi:hypothetical protein